MPLGGSRPKALLAALLLHRNEPVTTDQLMDMLWPEGGPEQPSKTIHVHVSRLRRALADPLAPSVLETHTGSYVLRVGPEELDIDRFAQLVADGRDALAAVDPAAASESLSLALGLWRGKALADFTYEPFAQAEIAHLEELRLGAVELAVDADLALGRHAMAVPRLERLTAEHPMRERMHGQLMLALYRCGRQADALAAYRRLRHTLDSELGLEPGPGLRRLEQRILRQEADLEAEPPRPAPPAAAAAPVRPAERRVRSPTCSPTPRPDRSPGARPSWPASRSSPPVSPGAATSRSCRAMPGSARRACWPRPPHGCTPTAGPSSTAAQTRTARCRTSRSSKRCATTWPTVRGLRSTRGTAPVRGRSAVDAAAGARAAAAGRAAADVGGARDRALAGSTSRSPPCSHRWRPRIASCSCSTTCTGPIRPR